MTTARLSREKQRKLASLGIVVAYRARYSVTK